MKYIESAFLLSMFGLFFWPLVIIAILASVAGRRYD